MSAVEQLTGEQLHEAAKAQARQFSQSAIKQGYEPTALHQYADASGYPVYWRIRLDKPEGGKWIRPLSINGNGQWQLADPDTKPMPLYRLPDIANSTGTVYVVEGEKCADALTALGLAATTSGSTGSANNADWTPLQSRTVVIWPDNDEPGTEYARAVSRALAGIADAVQLIDVAALNLPDKGDCADWLAMHPDADAASVANLDTRNQFTSKPNTSNNAWPEAQPLRREPPPPEPYPMDALGDVLGGAAEDLGRIIQAPDAVIGQSLLAGAALAVQAHADVTIDGRRSPLSLFFLTVAESGERKSATDSEVRAPHNKREQDLISLFDAELAAHEADAAAHDKARKEILGKKTTSREDARAALEDLGPAPSAPVQPILTSGDPTVEGFIKALMNGWPSMGLFSGEGGRFLGGYAMSKDNSLKTAAALSELWDGGAVERTRAGDGASKHYGKRASLHLLAQPGVASILLGDPMVRDQGLLSRMLVAWPQGKTGYRPYVPETVKQAPGMQRYFACLMAWLERDLPLAEAKRNELAPRELLLNQEAHAAFVAFYNYTETLMREGGALESIRGLANKAPAIAARMAGVLNLIADPAAQRITRDYMGAGIELMRYYLTEALRLHEVAAGNPDLALAERCLGWIRSDGNRTSLPDLYQRGPNPVRDKDTASRMLAILADHGLARPTGPGVIDGKNRTEVWEVKL